METSYTGALRNSGRAPSNARPPTTFRERRDIPVIAGARNVNEATAQIDGGDICWCQIQERYMETG